MRRLAFIPILLCFLTKTGTAKNGLECALTVHQVDSSETVLLLADTVALVKGIQATGFLLAFSVDIEITALDTARAGFNIHVVTLGPPVNTYSRSFSVEYGLPARITNIVGKNNAQYILTVIPLAETEVDTSLCEFNHYTDGTFTFNPTANMDIHYVPNSLADFYWNSVKELLEYEFRQYKSVFNLNLPGKYILFLCPCQIHSVIWDNRFGQAVIPTRNIGFALFSKEFNSADPFITAHAAVLRNFGYAPPFLSEGMAGYLSFAIFDMKKLVSNGKNVPLNELLDTYRYLKTDPVIADRTAATFVKFLIDSYGLRQFRQLYEASDDINLRMKITEQYGQSIDQLEKAWLTYVDSLTIPLAVYRQYAEQAEAMMDFDMMLSYVNGMIDLITNAQDSLISYSIMKQACFYTGDYYRAAQAQEALLYLNPGSAAGWMTMAAYELMNGLYDQAGNDLAKAREIDPGNNMIRFNQGLYYQLTDHTQEARLMYNDIINKPDDPAAQIEARVMLANILRASDDDADKAQAKTYYVDVLSMSEQQIQANSAAPTSHLWMGIASLGLGDTGNALQYLETALFLETRPFYLGMIYLWLGKLIDTKGDHSAARDYYGAVLAVPSADYHQKEARKYLEEPYQQ